MQNHKILIYILASLCISCSFPEEKSINEEEVEPNLEGSWELFNTKLESSQGVYQDYDMESGNQIYHFTKDSIFIISNQLQLVHQSEYKVQNNTLYYTTKESDSEFNVIKKITLSEYALELKDAQVEELAITFQLSPTKLKKGQLEYLKTNKVDWSLCAGTWVYKSHHLPFEEQKDNQESIPELSVNPLEFITISEAGNTCRFVKDTFFYTAVNDTSSWWTFVLEHFYSNKREPKKILLTIVEPKELNGYILEYHEL